MRGYLRDWHYKVGKDIPRGPIVLYLPLYPGLRRSSLPIHSPNVTMPATPYVKSASTTYLSRDGLYRIDAWYHSHILACGYTPGSVDQVTAAPALGYPDGTVIFHSIHNPKLELDIAYERVRHGVLVLYEAEQTVLPPRPADSYLPPGIVRIRLSNAYPSLAPPGMIVNPAAVQAMVHAVNALTDIEPDKVLLCAKGAGSDVIALTFIRAHGPPIRVTDDPACGGLVHVGHTRALQDQPGGIWGTLHRIIRNHWLQT